MVLQGFANKNAKASVEVAQAEAPEFEKVNWKTDGRLRVLMWHCAVLSVASVTTGYDGMMLNTSQLMDPWQEYFGHPDGSRLGVMNNAMALGSIVSFFFVPFTTDKFGRKVPIVIGCVIMIVGGIVSTVSTNWKIYLAGRLVLGFGNSFAQMCSPILLTEIAHPQYRAPLTAVYNCLWNLGALLVAWIGWACLEIPTNWSWRTITLLQIIPSVIQLMFIWWVPESPRWHISKGNNEKALSMLAYYHGNGDVAHSTVQFEYREIKETLTIEREVLKETSYLDFFRTKGNRWRLAIIVILGVTSQYSGSAIFSNYSNLIYEGAGIHSQNQKMPLNGGNTILSLIVSVSAALVVDRFGRRKLFLTATSGMVVMFICWTITSAVYENSGETNKAAGYVQIVFIWIFGVFYSLAWSGLLVAYALEVLPYHLRAKGLMIMNITVQAILAVGQQTNPIAWKNLPKHWHFALFYTFIIAIELCLVYFLFVETKGPTLEEVAKIFDGEGAVAHVDLHTIKKEIETGEIETRTETVEVQRDEKV